MYGVRHFCGVVEKTLSRDHVVFRQIELVRDAKTKTAVLQQQEYLKKKTFIMNSDKIVTKIKRISNCIDFIIASVFSNSDFNNTLYVRSWIEITSELKTIVTNIIRRNYEFMLEHHVNMFYEKCGSFGQHPENGQKRIVSDNGGTSDLISVQLEDIHNQINGLYKDMDTVAADGSVRNIITIELHLWDYKFNEFSTKLTAVLITSYEQQFQEYREKHKRIVDILNE